MRSHQSLRATGVGLAVVLLLAACASQAQAGLVLVTSRTALNGNDTIDWGQFGSTFTNVPNPSNFTTTGGLSGTVSKLQSGEFQRRDQGNGWGGNFTNGDRLLWTQDFNSSPNNIKLTFPHGISAGGAQIQADFFGAFTAQIQAFDTHGNPLGSFTENGTSNSNGDGSAIFIGVRDTTTPIGSIALSLTNAAFDPADFAINQFSLDSRVTSGGVPEPSTLALLGLGLGGLAVRRWRRRGA
jgi:hypothetical protein